MSDLRQAQGPVGSAGLPTITPEQIAAYQRQQAEKERQEDQAFLAEVQAFVAQRGYQIMAVPQLTPDGRTVATWGVIRNGAK